MWRRPGEEDEQEVKNLRRGAAARPRPWGVDGRGEARPWVAVQSPTAPQWMRAFVFYGEQPWLIAELVSAVAGILLAGYLGITYAGVLMIGGGAGFLFMVIAAILGGYIAVRAFRAVHGRRIACWQSANGLGAGDEPLKVLMWDEGDAACRLVATLDQAAERAERSELPRASVDEGTTLVLRAIGARARGVRADAALVAAQAHLARLTEQT